jgi:hypothetical protein
VLFGASTGLRAAGSAWLRACGLGDLSAAASGKTYTAPNGIALNATYINYLRRTLPSGSVRFRMTAKLEPVVIVANGSAVGVLMPVKQ